MNTAKTVLLVGGGSGGHIYPNIAVAERLLPPSATLPDDWCQPDRQPHLVVSSRPLDGNIAAASGLPFTHTFASPPSLRPNKLGRFVYDYCRGVAMMKRLIIHTRAAAVVSTGGFVSVPAVDAAVAKGLPVALVSLDVVPGRANRRAARVANAVFTAFEPTPDHPSLPGAQVIGFPLRRAAVASSEVTAAQARQHFGLDPDRPTLLIFAGSQGARTINRAIDVLKPTDFFAGWQVLHIRGPEQSADRLSETGSDPICFRGLPFCDRMDLAWRAASGGVALTRAGAGTVAEAWANAVPSVMLPYPFHKDQHQKHNAAPLVDLGGAIVMTDRIDPAANAESLRQTLGPLLRDEGKRAAMHQALRDHPPADGAQHLADWVRQQVG